MRKRGRMHLLLAYAEKATGWKEFTAIQLWSMQKDAVKHYGKEANAEATTNEILATHGRTREEWNKVLLHSGSFYFTPEPWMEEVNKEIKAKLQGKIYQEVYQLNYFHAILHSMAVNGTINRRKGDNGLWKYSAK